MRRKTIFRSELALALLTVALPVGVRAQQAPQRGLPPGARPAPAQAPTAPSQAPAARPQPQPAPSGAPAIGGGGGAFPQSAAPATPPTHTVAQGETLWSLAQQFLGDPLLWPEIYRLNTDVVEDPHWIYPGEVLKLTAPAEDTAAAAPVTGQSFVVAPPADTTAESTATQQPALTNPATGPTIFSQQVARAQPTTTLERLAARNYRAVREGEYYSSGFLTENQPLATGRILGSPTRLTSDPDAMVMLYEDVMVSAPAGDTLQPGDLLLVVRRGDEVEQYGQIVVPTGLLRVKQAAGGDRYVATVIRVYQPIALDQEVLPIQPFSLNTNRHAAPVSDGVTGSVIRLRQPHELAQRQQVLFIDKGANDGLKPGDLLEFYRMKQDDLHGTSIEQDLGRGIVVNTRAATCTVIVVALYSGDIGAGTLVRQIGRMPS